jgi:chemotaxis family two-component system response regulator Rcp1
VRRSPELLLVDDNPADVALAREALAETGRESCLHSVQGGEEAIAFLRHSGKYAHAVRPDLVILDLNLPKTSGLQVLAAMKADPDLRRIPVVIFSSSESMRDIAGCYEAGANCYVSKPGDLKRFFLVVQSIERFWFSYASLPLKENDGSTNRARTAD